MVVAHSSNKYSKPMVLSNMHSVRYPILITIRWPRIVPTSMIPITSILWASVRPDSSGLLRSPMPDVSMCA